MLRDPNKIEAPVIFTKPTLPNESRFDIAEFCGLGDNTVPPVWVSISEQKDGLGLISLPSHQQRGTYARGPRLVEIGAMLVFRVPLSCP
jgi:hypothetical protein